MRQTVNQKYPINNKKKDIQLGQRRKKDTEGINLGAQMHHTTPSRRVNRQDDVIHFISFFCWEEGK